MIDIKWIVIPPIFQKHLFLEHLCTMVSLSSIEKDSVATTGDCYKYCILACKIRNQTCKWMQTSKRKEKFHKLKILLRYCYSVRPKFCIIFDPLSVAKVLEKHVRSSSYLVLVFFKENSNLLYTYFFYNYFTSNYTYFWLVIEKSTNFINKN